MYWHIIFEVINIINYIILPDKADRGSSQEKKYCTLALTWRQKYLHFFGGKVKVYFLHTQRAFQDLDINQLSIKNKSICKKL